jgi:DNA polymerase III delta prime subunit
MEEVLHGRVIGQEEAVSAISRAIRRARVGLKNPNRPIASFIFAGPTGVGKSELAKTLAAYYFGSEEAMVGPTGGRWVRLGGCFGFSTLLLLAVTSCRLAFGFFSCRQLTVLELRLHVKTPTKLQTPNRPPPSQNQPGPPGHV